MRENFLPFSKPSIGKEEIAEVTQSLESGWITTGPKVQQFEADVARYVGAPHAIALNSATAGLHVAYLAAGLKPGDEVITTPLTFISTVSMLAAIGAKPVLADIDLRTFNIDCSKIEEKITSRTKMIVPVHFAGQACDMDAIGAIARKHKLTVVEDAAHAIGTEYKGKKVGSMSDATVFSFHPIKNMTTGEGGMITTARADWAEEMALLRFHGMNKNAWKRYAQAGSPLYDISRLGFKYNMMDIQAGIGIHQLKKLPDFNAVRARYAAMYEKELRGIDEIVLPEKAPYDQVHSWHLYVMALKIEKMKINREEFIQKLSEQKIGTGVHFTAVHRHSYYEPMFKGVELPNASYVSDRILSLPLYPGLTEADVRDVIEAVKKTVRENSKSSAVAV